jgi:hypothetical protein
MWWSGLRGGVGFALDYNSPALTLTLTPTLTRTRTPTLTPTLALTPTLTPTLSPNQVAFALAAKIYSDNNFPAKCGGGMELAGCDPNNAMNDSEAILQTTMLIAALTIFVFGGSITALAIKVLVYILTMAMLDRHGHTYCDHMPTILTSSPSPSRPT